MKIISEPSCFKQLYIIELSLAEIEDLRIAILEADTPYKSVKRFLAMLPEFPKNFAHLVGTDEWEANVFQNA